MLRQSPNMSLEMNFQTQSMSEGMSLLRAKSRDKMGPANTVGQPPDRPGEADCFHGLIANFYSVKTEKIPARSLVLSD